MTYPEGVIDKLRAKGLQFEGDTPINTPPARPKIHQKSQQTSNPTSAASSSKSKIATSTGSWIQKTYQKIQAARQQASSPHHS